MAGAQNQGGQPTADGERKPLVLLVDDDDDFCASTTVLLESEGYAVSRAATGKEALAKIGTEVLPDLIVLDIMMENTSAGYEVNQAFKFGSASPVTARIPIVMVSSIGLGPEERFRFAGEVPLVTPDEYFVKPLDIPRFLTTVKNLLRRSH